MVYICIIHKTIHKTIQSHQSRSHEEKREERKNKYYILSTCLGAPEITNI